MKNEEKLNNDLKKYESEISAVNKRLTELDEQRQSLMTHGRRMEGIVAYLRAELASAESLPKAEPKAEAELAPAEESAKS